MRFADPKPAYCSACFNSGDESSRFIDFEAAWDGPVVLAEDGSIALAPNGTPSTNDDLYLCESCVKAAAEAMGMKPELHSRQLREIRRLELENAHWKATSKRLQEELATQTSAHLEPPIRGTRTRVAA